MIENAMHILRFLKITIAVFILMIGFGAFVSTYLKNDITSFIRFANLMSCAKHSIFGHI